MEKIKLKEDNDI